MFVKQLCSLLLFFLLFSTANADAKIRVFAVGCKATFKVKPMCENETHESRRLTYNPIYMKNKEGDPTPDTSWEASEILGIGDSFAEAWDDAHKVCEKRACSITSCETRSEYVKATKINLGCQCSYKTGDTCIGRLPGNTGEVALLPGRVSSMLERADQICEQKLRETPDVPEHAVAFAHDCSGLSQPHNQPPDGSHIRQ